MSYEDILQALPDATPVAPGCAEIPAAAAPASYDVLDVTAPFDAGFPAHRHPWEESIFVVSGEVEVWVAGQRILLQTDDSTQIRPGREHRIRVLSDVAHFLVVTPSPLAESSVRTLNLAIWPSRRTLDNEVLEALEKATAQAA